MDIKTLHEQINRIYTSIVNKALASKTNFLEPNFPLKLNDKGQFVFLPSSSVAIQSVLPESDYLTNKFYLFIEELEDNFPFLKGKIFWQPRGTYHLNVIILKRLDIYPIEKKEILQIIKKAHSGLVELRSLSSYDVDYKGIIISSDSSVIAIGYPNSLVPFNIREKFKSIGFKDQQVLYHISLGRLLSILNKSQWHSLVNYITKNYFTNHLGRFKITQAILINEHEGFLHNPAVYEVLEQINFT